MNIIVNAEVNLVALIYKIIDLYAILAVKCKL